LSKIGQKKNSERKDGLGKLFILQYVTNICTCSSGLQHHSLAWCARIYSGFYETNA